jgi:hypothetical protein
MKVIGACDQNHLKSTSYLLKDDLAQKINIYICSHAPITTLDVFAKRWLYWGGGGASPKLNSIPHIGIWSKEVHYTCTMLYIGKRSAFGKYSVRITFSNILLRYSLILKLIKQLFPPHQSTHNTR